MKGTSLSPCLTKQYDVYYIIIIVIIIMISYTNIQLTK